jgi:dethiobiotin synthetase
VAALDPDLVLVVADAGLGTINSIRLSVDALAGERGAKPEVPVAVVLNRFDGDHEIHRRNRTWLESRDGYLVIALPGGETELADLALGV